MTHSLPMIDLMDFCWKGQARDNLKKPWSLDQWTYASNGHIAIRVPRRDDVPENPKAPEIEQHFALAETLEFKPFTLSIPPLDYPNCSTCGGRGWGVTCRACNGTGEHNCDCDYCDRQCSECDGYCIEPADSDDVPEKDRIPCEECDGSGKRPDERRVHFPKNLTFKAALLNKVLALPGPIEMGMILEPKSSVPYYPPQHFRGPGWNAVVMPMIATAPNPEDIIVAQEEEPASA